MNVTASEIVLSLLLAVLVLSSAWSTRVFMREIMRLMAQTDERIKSFMRNSDKVLDRWMAMTAPNNYGNMRDRSGLVEGAQYATRQHFAESPGSDGPAPSAAADKAREAREAIRAEAERPVLTTLDFDRNGPAQ